MFNHAFVETLTTAFQTVYSAFDGETFQRFIVHHQKANGHQMPKTFKLTKCTLAPGATITLTKKHSFRPITTRRYYPGEHAIEIQINGRLSGRQTLMLVGEGKSG